jgi:hypothetical protein
VSNVVVLPGRASTPAPDAADATMARDQRLFLAARNDLLDISSSLLNLMPLLARLQRLVQDEMHRQIDVAGPTPAGSPEPQRRAPSGG